MAYDAIDYDDSTFLPEEVRDSLEKLDPAIATVTCDQFPEDSHQKFAVSAQCLDSR